jgi:hypothetical protein
MARRHLTLTLLAVTLFLSLTYFMTGKSNTAYAPTTKLDDTFLPGDADDSTGGTLATGADISDRILQGGSIAPKLGNATAKYAVPPTSTLLQAYTA